MRSAIRTLALGLVGSIAWLAPAAADYPEQPIKFIVPYAQGGSVDILTRMVQQALEKEIPQPVVVINKTGAGGMLAAREGREAAADGYTILNSSIAMYIASALGRAEFSYGSFVPLAETGRVELVIVVPKNSPYDTMEALLQAARDKPETITHATHLTSFAHLATLQLMNATGASFRFVQVGGGGKRKVQVLGGHVDSSIQGVSEIVQEHASGDLKVLALLSRERSELLPGVPTIVELGYDYDPLTLSFWWMAPAGTPAARTDYLIGALERAFTSKQMWKAVSERGFTPSFLKGDALRKKMATDMQAIDVMVTKFGVGKE